MSTNYYLDSPDYDAEDNDAEEARQQLARELDYDGEEMSTLMGAVTMAGVLYRARGIDLDRSEAELDAEAQGRAGLAIELRALRHLVGMVRVSTAPDARCALTHIRDLAARINALIARLEDATAE